MRFITDQFYARVKILFKRVIKLNRKLIFGNKPTLSKKILSEVDMKNKR